MTPTLSGRWQSRLFLLGSIGALISYGFSRLFNSVMPLVLLAVVIFLGLIWDYFYDKIQQRRWDHDWPPMFQLLAGIFEGVFIFALIQNLPFPGLPNVFQFWAHYITVWVFTFLTSQSIMRLIFPRWRFNGGVWL